MQLLCCVMLLDSIPAARRAGCRGLTQQSLADVAGAAKSDIMSA